MFEDFIRSKPCDVTFGSSIGGNFYVTGLRTSFNGERLGPLLLMIGSSSNFWELDCYYEGEVLLSSVSTWSISSFGTS